METSLSIPLYKRSRDTFRAGYLYDVHVYQRALRSSLAIAVVVGRATK